ncbi:TonB-dependent receptor [Croceicoccus sediminis]|uniref:TonB-dependent receptor n=1 Tax=Croceicoccus sediminis TaxID=2571150 RepID=UPI0014795D2C|nr:TonB-dependent receptor [Croceicoccus sediminis]
MQIKRNVRTALLIGSILSPTAFAGTAHAQSEDPEIATGNAIIVTATRRADTVQDVPFNIAAVTSESLEAQRTLDLESITATVPGVYIVDAGPRQGNTIVFRGLNADPLTAQDGDNSGGGTVSIYVGEIPLYVNLRPIDMERVEVLIGPQGTLYGAGTLGGAVRYIPNRPQFDGISGEVRADLYSYKHGDGISTDTGMTVNVPVSDRLAFRGSLDLLNDRGFIDQPFVVTDIGAVNPDDFSNPDAVRRHKDTNWAEIVNARAALRWQPVDAVDINLTYYLQDLKVGGRQLTHNSLNDQPLLDSNGDFVDFPVEVGDYENALRVLEPNRIKNELIALEAVVDLGFAELTSASGYSKYSDDGNRDQTDLLITLEYSYELFPTFTSRTQETGEEETWTQELRLVSTSGGPLSWIVGGFFNKRESDSLSLEFTPNLDVYYGTDYPQNIEYVQAVTEDLKEYAVFGEVGYEILSGLQVTLGGRYYKYNYKVASAFDLPLFEIAFGGRDPANDIQLDYEESGQKKDGFLWKVNASYEFNPDALAYATVSTGYRIGSGNGIAACPPGFDPNDPGNQTLCALPDEFAYGPDETTNYEVGFKTQWLNRRLTLNGALYYIDWKGPQLSTVTLAGGLPITVNGAGAESKGVELSGSFRVTPDLTISANYSYTDAKLTALSPDLIAYTEGPGFPTLYEDGLKGDRLPGSPKHKGNIFVSYKRPVGPDTDIGFTYKMTAQSNILTRAGGRRGTTLDGFALHGAALTLDYRGFSTQLYVDNLFDKYAETGVRSSPEYNQVVYDENDDPHFVRRYGTFVTAPRTIGIRSILRF